MDGGIARSADRRTERAAGNVAAFASRIVASLVARGGAPAPVLSEALLQRFMDLIRDPRHLGIQALQPDLRRERVSASELADHYIPEVARRIGAAWEEDCVTFSDVTIGTARLQAILREIGASWAADAGGDPDRAARALLLVVPQNEQHTLGAVVLAGRLRRMGISVCLQVGPSVADLSGLLASRRFDGAMISIACTDRLASGAALVDRIRSGCNAAFPVAIGGAVLERRADVAQIAGADLATNDIDAALAFFGMSSTTERLLEFV